MNTERFSAESHIRQMTTNDATGTVFIVTRNGHSSVSTQRKRSERDAERKRYEEAAGYVVKAEPNG